MRAFGSGFWRTYVGTDSQGKRNEYGIRGVFLYALREINGCLIAKHPGRYPNWNRNPDLQSVGRVGFLVGSGGFEGQTMGQRDSPLGNMRSWVLKQGPVLGIILYLYVVEV